MIDQNPPAPGSRTDLFEFVQFGDSRHTGQTHVDEAEHLQVGELLRDPLHLPVAGAAVVQNQLMDLTRPRTEPVYCINKHQRNSVIL